MFSALHFFTLDKNAKYHLLYLVNGYRKNVLTITRYLVWLMYNTAI